MADETTRICACDERYEARAKCVFIFSPRDGAWIFPEGPKRHVSNPWLSEYHETTNHDCEPYVFDCCPWCGGDLPPQDSFNPYFQSDGCSGDEGAE